MSRIVVELLHEVRTSLDACCDMLFHRALAESEFRRDFALRVTVDLLEYECAAALYRQVADRIAEKCEFLVGRRIVERPVREPLRAKTGRIDFLSDTVGQARFSAFSMIERQIAHGTVQIGLRCPDAGWRFDLADANIRLLHDVLDLGGRHDAGHGTRKAAAQGHVQLAKPLPAGQIGQRATPKDLLPN